MNRIYAGIGSRKTPPEIMELMEDIAFSLSLLGFTLRSGGAKGADAAFEEGSEGKAEIFLPYEGFNGSNSPLFLDGVDMNSPVFQIADKFYHSDLKKKPLYTKAFMTRNVHQVLGITLEDPVDFVVCYTSDGKNSGGTGQALRIANHHKIPIYNLYYDLDILNIKQLIKELQNAE